MSAVSSARSKKVDPLSKKIQPNPKYKHVKPTIDTGSSVSKYLERLEELKKNYKFKKNEIFKRMKVSTLVQLIIQIAEVEFTEHDRNINPTDLGDGDRPTTADREVQQICEGEISPPESVRSRDGAESSRSTLQQVIRGVGEIDVDQPPPPPRMSFVDDTCPYLLLDVREKDAYDQCHIISAKTYPKAMLSRSQNYETADLLQYRNATGKIIVIYDENETLAPEAAMTFVQRGYDNIFMLSGGLKVAYKNFPEGLITGTIPKSCLEEKSQKSIVLPPRKHFLQEDTDRLVLYKDNVLGDNSIGSRLSRASTTSRAMSVQSTKSFMTSTSTDHKPPFKP